ncbi:MAG: DUF4013 domain-containing protein [Candidatus Methanoperedens sp.]|nr:DUF4013 domain-containing protein [Candidatus Methanoperedens sp.]
MAVEFEKALKYPLSFKPLLMLGMLFFIVLLALFIPSFSFSKDMLTGATSDGIFSPIILYIIFFVTALILLFTFFNGYMVSVSRSIIAGNHAKAPEITDIGRIFIDGIKFMIIGLVYAIAPLLFLLLALMATYILWAFISVSFAEAVTIILMFLYIFLLYPLFFVFHIAGAHFARTGSVRKALNIPYIYSLVFGNIKAYTIDFFIYFIVTLVYSIAIMFIVTYPFVIIASYVAGQYIFTMFYLESTGFIAESENY